MRIELDILRKMRNEFAHSDQAINFKTPAIIAICKKLSYVVQPPIPADRLRTAYIITLLYVHLNTEMLAITPIKEKNDYFDGESKKAIEQTINEIRLNIATALGQEDTKDMKDNKSQ